MVLKFEKKNKKKKPTGFHVADGSKEIEIRH